MVSMVRACSLVVGLAVAVLGCKGSETEAQSEAVATGNLAAAAELTETVVQAESEAPQEAPPPAADPAHTRTCRTYATETAQACRDFLYKGGVPSCMQHFGNVDLAREQSQGNLFDDVEPAPDPRVHPVPCKVRLGMLRRERDEQPLAERSWGPQCLQLFEWLESNCLDGLGKKKPAQGCLLTLGMAGAKNPANRDAEGECAAALRMVQ